LLAFRFLFLVFFFAHIFLFFAFSLNVRGLLEPLCFEVVVLCW
jgi:hypothetical protein